MSSYSKRPKCPHGRLKRDCRLCGGEGFCPHKRRRGTCIECGTGQICVHNKVRSSCVECSGCPHGKRRYLCVDCGSTAYCTHGKMRNQCIDCIGGCEHGKRRMNCVVCGIICTHGKCTHKCTICSPMQCLARAVRARTLSVLPTSKGYLNHLGCTIEELHIHLEKQFQPGMCWDNRGLWQMDHYLPLSVNRNTYEEIVARLHYTNIQPLWTIDNKRKGCTEPEDTHVDIKNSQELV